MDSKFRQIDHNHPNDQENPEQSSQYREEAASEVAPMPAQVRDREQVKNQVNSDQSNPSDISGRSIGIFGFVLSVLSLLFMPILLGAAGIIVGFFARSRNAETLGNWAIAIGAISVIVSLFFSPFF